MMARQASRRMGELQRPTPTAETQELYNKMRRAEERLTIESMHQIQTGSSGRSPPLSTSPGTATPTSASYDSTTQSISQVMDGVTVEEDPSQAIRSRCGRHGPLPEAKKLRAALLRKLKACDDCRARKVKCAHFDFSLFEDAYQATKQPISPPVDSDLHPTGPESFQPRLGDLLVDLLGVGDGQNPTGPPSSLVFGSGGMDETQPDLDPLRNQQPQLQPHLASIFSAFDGPHPRVPVLDLARQPARIPQTRPLPPRTITVGRQIDPWGDFWECLWGHPQPASLQGLRGSAFRQPQTSTLPGFCGAQFTGVDALTRHVQQAHGLFYQRGWSVWQCQKCGLELSKLPAPSTACPMCSQGDPVGWQLWHYARL